MALAQPWYKAGIQKRFVNDQSFNNIVLLLRLSAKSHWQMDRNLMNTWIQMLRVMDLDFNTRKILIHIKRDDFLSLDKFSFEKNFEKYLKKDISLRSVQMGS